MVAATAAAAMMAAVGAIRGSIYDTRSGDVGVSPDSPAIP